jgi:hypothetical protein
MSIRTYQAIVTKYIGPSNTKGSRIKAIAAAGSLTVHINNALNIEDNHRNAAEALANKFKWRGAWYGGGMPDDTGYCWVSHDMDDAPHFFTAGE